MLLLLAFVLLLFLPGPWNVIGFVVALALFIGEVAYWNSTVKGRRATGRSGDADRQDRHRDVGVPTRTGRSSCWERSGPPTARPAPRPARRCG